MKSLKAFRAFEDSINEKRSFTKTDAILNLKKGNKVLCTYVVHPLNTLEENGLLLEIVNKEASSELIERYRMRTNQQISQDFVRGLAHEIKNPLSGIRGSAQLLRNKLKEFDLKEYTDIIIKQTDRLTSLVDNILGPNKSLTSNFKIFITPSKMFLSLLIKRVDMIKSQ